LAHLFHLGLLILGEDFGEFGVYFFLEIGDLFLLIGG